MLFSLAVFLCLVNAIIGIPILERGISYDYSSEKIQGVNLGGWFLLEPYITPSLFDAFQGGNIPVDEFHYCETLGKDECKKRLTKHWDSWYSEDDFEQMSKAGLNAVRIPLGYWAFKMYDYDPYVSGQQKYLDRAIDWCRKHNLKVWIDLHGAAGSQNGFDNSGIRDQVQFQSNPYNVAMTLDALKILADKYGGSDYEDVIIGIELLNEPLGPALDMDKLKDFYNKGYKEVRDSGSIQPVIIHDAFKSAGYWNDFMTNDDGTWDVLVDHHHYQVFSAGELQRSMDQHISTTCNEGFAHTKEYHWNLVGEWSAALTDCARWLNGVGRGARWSGDYDNSPYINSCDQFTEFANWPDWQKTNTRKYIEAQLDAYTMMNGYFFWNWKCENAIEWDMKELIKEGMFPQPLNDRQYPNQCY